MQKSGWYAALQIKPIILISPSSFWTVTFHHGDGFWWWKRQKVFFSSLNGASKSSCRSPPPCSSSQTLFITDGHMLPSLTLPPRVKTNESISEWIGAQIYFPWCRAHRLPPLAAADGAADGDDGEGGDVAEGLQEFMIRANGRICILLHMSLPNGCLHTEVMMEIIKHGEQVNCCTQTQSSALLETQPPNTTRKQKDEQKRNKKSRK